MRNFNAFRFLVFVSTVSWASAGWDDWMKCPLVCSCKWISGKKAADCKNKDIHLIPEGLSNEIQTIDLSGNSIANLPDEAFKSVNLTSLSKINLQSSQIREIHVGAFKQLGNLVELDLSENRIHVLYSGTFDENRHLRILILRKNSLRKIQSNLFHLNNNLQKLHLDDCMISEIDEDAFHNLTNLSELKIEGNKLSTLTLKTFRELTKLRSFYVFNNNWTCDCHLRPLRNWMIEKSLLNEPTYCAKPERLLHKNWREINPDDFACEPQIIWPLPGKAIIPEEQNVEVGCKVTGNPMPVVSWFHNSRLISQDSSVKYKILTSIIMENDGPLPTRWVNLSVHDVSFQDKGRFRCVAESPGGSDERNISLLLEGDGGGVVGVAGYNIDSWPLIIGLATGLIAFLIVVCLLICCVCCRYRQRKSSKASVSSSDKQDESLLAVNPIQKPPRSCDAKISPDEGVELSEINTKLLDENSLHGTVCTSEGGQSAEFLDSIPEDRQDAYPPDLLSFPSRRYNTSPAGGSISKAFDPLRTPLSPGVHSLPPHRYNFGTLPYSRSHSPLAAGGPPIVLPRQGYVTIPRRPRIPSWSSAPTPSLLDDPLSPTFAEPIYDNLGPRTTADGSSVLSLNKSIPENPRKKKNPMPYYFHFESPCPSPLAATDNDPKKEEFKKPGPPKTQLPEVTVTTPVKKIAPKPPPKPKKTGPLFEDEGEDGTEV